MGYGDWIGIIELTCKLGQLCEIGGIDKGSIGTGIIAHQWKILRIMSTTPKVILITQPMDVIYNAMFEGDAAWHLEKFISFFVDPFMFFNFFGLFQIRNLEK